jgi:hypothetical protein
MIVPPVECSAALVYSATVDSAYDLCYSKPALLTVLVDVVVVGVVLQVTAPLLGTYLQLPPPFLLIVCVLNDYECTP